MDIATDDEMRCMTMSKALSEAQVLKALDIPDFRHITKDKIMSFASLLDNIEPAVAKKALEQFPEFAQMTLETLQDYRGIVEKAQDNAAASGKQCLELYNEVVQALKACLNKENLPFEEKKYYIEKMMEVAKMAEAKDTEGKLFNWKILRCGATVVVIIIGIGATLLGGKSDLHLPWAKS